MNVVASNSRVAFAVGDLEKARSFFGNVLGAQFDSVQDVQEFQFRYQPFRLGGIEMQLICPYDPSSVISHFLMKRGQGFHHLTLEVKDLEAAIRELEAKGIEVVSRHDYQEALEGHSWKDAFIHPRDAFGVLVQFIQKT